MPRGSEEGTSNPTASFRATDQVSSANKFRFSSLLTTQWTSEDRDLDSNPPPCFLGPGTRRGALNICQTNYWRAPSPRVVRVTSLNVDPEGQGQYVLPLEQLGPSWERL